MKFEPDLARQILLAVEELPSPYNNDPIEIDGYSQDEISYHIKLLTEAEFLISHEASTFGKFLWLPQHLTYDGQNFLSAVKKDTTWNKAKSLVKANGWELTLTAIKAVLTDLIK